MSKIEVSHIYKIFGPHPERWLKAVQEGMSKEELLTRSGHTLGLRDISLSIDEGSIYVIMGPVGVGQVHAHPTFQSPHRAHLGRDPGGWPERGGTGTA